MRRSGKTAVWMAACVLVIVTGSKEAVEAGPRPPAPSAAGSASAVRPAAEAAREGPVEASGNRRKSVRPEMHRSSVPAPPGGLDVTPPRIDRITPAPGRWVVDNVGLDEVRIGFSEAVIVPPGAVRVWTVGGGDVGGFTSVYDDTPNVWTLH
ncbi:MAG: hypothetical protein D6788_04280, partial [Planctomycetota bacterium]